ncbi:MAG: peptidyl-prolyl cis-trans isomerase [Pseudomonadota bacterium]
MKKSPWGRIVVVAVAVVLGISIFGCSKTDGDKSAGDAKTKTVIQIDDQKIDAAVVEKYLERRAVPMHAENAGELVKKRVDELVDEELQYREALRLKLDQDPETRQKIKEILKQKLSEEQIHKKVMEKKIEQPELQSYYDAHRDEFNRPAEVRVADVFIAVPKDASADQRAELKQKADKVLAEALAGPNPRAGFSRLVREYSDMPQTYAKGDTGFFSPEGKPVGIDPRIVEAAFKLEKSGDIPAAVIEAADGYHIIMLNSKRPAFNKSFEQVASHLERRIKSEEINKRRVDFLQELKGKAKIVIDEKVVAEIQEKLKTASKMVPKTPATRNFSPIPGSGPQTPPIMRGADSPPAMPEDRRHQPPPISPMNDPAAGPITPFNDPKADGK